MREGSDLAFDLHVFVVTWMLGMVALWRVLEIGSSMRLTFTDWVVFALVPVYLVYLEVLNLRRRAAVADDWH